MKVFIANFISHSICDIVKVFFLKDSIRGYQVLDMAPGVMKGDIKPMTINYIYTQAR